MTDDLVQRLRGHSKIMERDKGKFVRFIDVATCTEAADRIEALEAENERLRGRLAHAEDDCEDACIYCEERRQEIAIAARRKKQ